MDLPPGRTPHDYDYSKKKCGHKASYISELELTNLSKIFLSSDG